MMLLCSGAIEQVSLAHSLLCACAVKFCQYEACAWDISRSKSSPVQSSPESTVHILQVPTLGACARERRAIWPFPPPRTCAYIWTRWPRAARKRKATSGKIWQNTDTFLNGQSASCRSRREQTDTCRKTLREKQASETAQLRETGCAGLSVVLRQQQRLTSDSRGDRQVQNATGAETVARWTETVLD